MTTVEKVALKTVVPGSEISVIKFKGQDYNEIKKTLLESGSLFEDPEFLAANTSINNVDPPSKLIVWKRPKEITADPKFFNNGVSRFDLIQGCLGDCWMLASIAGLAQHPPLLTQVVLPDQSFEQDYCGMFRFRLWQFGSWIEVLVDDRLPADNDELIFLHSASKSEFWCALLEKAWAKIYGCYFCLQGGMCSEAMIDITAGVVERYVFANSTPPDLFSTLQRALTFNSLAACSIQLNPEYPNQTLPNGLLTGHSYTISGAAVVNDPDGNPVQLVRVRNPWGGEFEWNGHWSDKSSEWDHISESERAAIGYSSNNDGEFWISFQDLQETFNSIEICLLSPEIRPGAEEKADWNVKYEYGQWRTSVTAGGTRSNKSTFYLNPQYRVKLKPISEEDQNCPIIICLQQTNRRAKKLIGTQVPAIGFYIYKVTEQALAQERLSQTYLNKNDPVARSMTFIRARDCCYRFTLPAGTYAVIPATSSPKEEGDFLLRIFTEVPCKARVLDFVTSISPVTYSSENLDAEHLVEISEGFHSLAGENDEIDAVALQSLLNSVISPEFSTKEKVFTFSLACTKALMNMLDKGQCGTVKLQSVLTISCLLLIWRETFAVYDINKSNDMDIKELREAALPLGFKMSISAMSSLVKKFGSSNGVLTMEDFILCCATLRIIQENYANKPDRAEMNLDSYIMEFLGI